jgi:hypothetical protein
VEARTQTKRSSFLIGLSKTVNKDPSDETAITASKIGEVNQRLSNLAAGGLAHMPIMPKIPISARKVNKNLMKVDEKSRQMANSSLFVEKQPSSDLGTGCLASGLLGEPNGLGDSWAEIKTPGSVKEVRGYFNFSEADKNIRMALGSEKSDI